MIVQCIPDIFKYDLLKGVHDFSASGGDVFKIALYSSSADLGQSTTVYTTSGEISGTGYSAGGATLTNIEPSLSSGVAYADFSDVTWTTATFTARGAMIYNSSAGNKAIKVLDFGTDKSVAAQDFTVRFPTADAVNAIIRIS